MSRKHFLSLPATTLLALALALGLFGANSHTIHAAAANKPTVIHVIDHDDSVTVDTGVPGDSPGDLVVFNSPFYDVNDQVQVGHDNGSCIRTVVGQAYECNWTNFFKDGQITVEGPDYDHTDSVLAVIGGTGRYSNARGQMILHYRGNSEYDYIFSLSL
ncbi:MAG: dirigent protein [Ktedonobacteraceae bacterium]|nr:dirigent protein [Ktedonobacteraceae bacterium]